MNKVVRSNIALLFLMLAAPSARAQKITIGGNVYGGGNEGYTSGSTTVTIRDGQISKVFGGGRMADVGGRAFVNIDGEHAASTNKILIGSVYGGNDISGTVGTAVSLTDTGKDQVPSELTDVLRGSETVETHPLKNDINNSWSAFIRSSKMTDEETFDHAILVGSVYGGGNGDYVYSSTDDTATGKTTHSIYEADGTTLVASKVTNTGEAGFTEPELAKTYLEINGGCLSQVYGGGNKATVTNNTVISMDNTSKGLQEVIPAKLSTETDEQYRARLMGILESLATFTGLSTFQGNFASLNYTSSRVFGGNNKATMTIHPHWNLKNGKIRDLYSGGNEGDMTNSYGLLLDIQETSKISVINVYGGCRKANVHPLYNGAEVPSSDVQLPEGSGYRFPAGYSARVIVKGGDITNVYGGNDITGRVWGGTAVGVYTSIRGDVYGGGNGSYAYTDNAALKSDPNYRDFYYEVPAGSTSVEALNNFRPHVEQTSLRLWGKDEDHRTIIGGSVYVGGNSATVIENPSLSKQTIELKIGSYVIADKVFLGDNGEQMVGATAENVLHIYKSNVPDQNGASQAYSTLDLEDASTLDQYMKGCAMSLHPHIVFDNTENGDPYPYIDYSSYIGSLFCGGNIGSMTWSGTTSIKVDHPVNIYDKFVAGCNNAFMPAVAGLSNVYWGGVIGSETEFTEHGMENPDGSIKNAIELDLAGLKIKPMRWVTKRDGSYEPVLSAEGKPIYLAKCEHGCELATINAVCEHDKQAYLEWNTIEAETGKEVANPTELAAGTTRKSTDDDLNRRLKGGNIYGGCYTAGIVNGNVVININETIMDREDLFANVAVDAEGEDKYYETEEYDITKVNSGVIAGQQGMDVFGQALNVFGGGYGAGTEIWGSTTINLKEGYVFQVFGGAEQGVIGKPVTKYISGLPVYPTTPLADGAIDANGNYAFNGYLYVPDERCSTHINLDGPIAGVARHSEHDSKDMAETEFIYGGAFEGPIMGSAIVHLGNGRIFNSFAGSCNADIMGHTETYMGINASEVAGFPFVRDHIYGGNDFGGKIYGTKDFLGHVREDVAGIKDNIYDKDYSTKASAYVEYQQGRVKNIFGGCYGDYDYTDTKFSEFCNTDGTNKAGFSKPRLGNAFVNFRPVSSSNTLMTVNQVYGAGQGRHYVIERDVMQKRSYILVDIPQAMTQFENTAFFGAGAYSGLGMEFEQAYAQANPDSASAIIDLFRGQVKNIYGGSFNEGITRRTVINLPAGSTLTAQNIFGGAYGTDNRYPCDVFESNVNYDTETEITGGIYGGNNNARRTLYTNVNINGYLWSNKTGGFQGYVYGAGKGEDTWAEYTNVTIGDGGVVYKAFGGGDAGLVLNKESLLRKKELAEAETDPDKKGLDLRLGTYTNNYLDEYLTQYGQLALDIKAGITRDYYHKQEKYNTNVHILKGAYVTGYGYGGGYGATATVSGTTYIDVLGGIVDRDVYAGGQGGSVHDIYGLKTFTATTNAYIKGGTTRNVYGGAYLGPVGHHEGKITDATTNDVLGRTNVVIGVRPEKLEANPKSPGDEGYDPDYHFYNGIPAITRNAFGGGEGGSIFGSTHLTVNNGYVGYRYTPSVADDAATPKFDERYVEELDDPGQGEAASKDAIKDAGNAFGGGYVANSYSDSTYLAMYGGHLRGNMYGGGEIGPIGRGTRLNGSGGVLDAPTITQGGATHVYLYNGHVHRSVFGGGRGYDSWGGDGTKYMTAEQIANSDFNTKGYVFGCTDVHVRGGIVGTTEGVRDGLSGDGNVFGGGDLGYVYSADGRKLGTRGEALSATDGLPENGGGYYYRNGDRTQGMTVDCNVDVAPYCQVKAGQSITLPALQTDADGNFVRATSGEGIGYPVKTGGTITFNEYDYVPVEYLDLLNQGTGTYGSSVWDKIDYESGIVIHNAVFAGGNVSVGSDQVFVNTNTVYGNVTAALRDVYHRDLITVGTEHIGGLYGDGNLTFVDGFRELTVSNYGTDFYNLSEKITIERYHELTDRERAYFRLEYECQQACTDKNGKEYAKGNTLTQSEYEDLFEGTTFYKDESYWKEAGFCSIYAGRLLNTLQRADFIGVWGSRMVLQGARDRVPEKADYTNYTLNRVGEVSLNCMKTQCSEDTGEEVEQHGNYFGIYSIVNYLGNLTSDVDFHTAVRYTKHDDPVGTGNKGDVNGIPYGTATYSDWKEGHFGQKNRNNGSCANMVALASGVYLELINESTEKRTDGKNDWGYITGVVELDLISVMQGLGGGYVYAKNEHGAPTLHSDWSKVTMSPYNRYAVTYKRYTYATVTPSDETETSGNFIHYTKQIVDDCYPIANSFYGPDAQDAHFWYIKGSIYVYDQYISAYTGSASAYSKDISIPLTISASAHGKMELVQVQPNLFAYYADTDKTQRLGDTGAEEQFVVNNVTYKLNDPITYWDYEMLSDEDKKHFVAKTYTVIDSCMIGSTLYPKGYTMLQDEFDDISSPSPEVLIKDSETGNWVVDPKGEKDFAYMFRLSNNISHDNGYILTYAVDNPLEWNHYYTKEDLTGTATDPVKMTTKEYTDASQPGGYIKGATYRLTDTDPGVFGQKEYSKGDIIDNSIQSTYDAIPDSDLPSGQATFKTAYVVNQEMIVTDDNGDEHHIFPGVAIAQSEYNNSWSTISSKVSPALVVTSTLELATGQFLYAGDLYSEAQLKAYIKEATGKTDAEVDEFYAANNSYYAEAFYCTEAGLYGGNLYRPGVAYQAVDAWSAMSEADREHFTFNYDALDLLIDPAYANIITRYDGTNDPKIYSVATPVDYTAKLTGATSISYTNKSGSTVTYDNTMELSRLQFEDIPNERRHYAPISVTDPEATYYVVHDAFIRGDMPYSVGQSISEELYGSLTPDQKLKVTAFNFSSQAASATESSPAVFYYCRDPYMVNEKGMGETVTNVFSSATVTSGNTVPLGFVITEDNYTDLPNKTVDNFGNSLFSIYGRAPLETSTLYVSRESDILDLSKEKTITAIFEYRYEESDESGLHITPITERHILNIHLQFMSGVPEIGELAKPKTILPGTTVGLKVPNITPGAFEVLGSGWEIFTNSSDATSHKNGQPYVNNDTKMYWYQDGYYVAYYAKTYLGKTYSNAVEFDVANYHDLDKVMQDKEHHYYLDHKDAHRQRDPKVYIDNRACTSDPSKNELDLLKDFFELTLHDKQYNAADESLPIATTGALAGHHGVDVNYIGAAKKLQFYLRSDMSPKAYTTWQPIGTDAQCFEGTLHGDGYTISGLSNSLFHKLCGEIYNLGVTGSFTTAGIVDTGSGYVENCWVKSDAATVNSSVKAVFGDPSDTEHPTSRQVVNCYYPETNAYSEADNAHGNARKMPLQAFYNGEVTYDLNGFYLNKRFFDQTLQATGNKAYGFWRANGDGSLPTEPETEYYTPAYSIYPLVAGRDGDQTFGYVEDRYADGDFIYAGESIPETKDQRLNSADSKYYPIWPDDYLFFGQRLTYGYVDGRPHQDTPAHINKSNTRLTHTSTDVNRVFRAPAYFRSKEMGVAHYNPYAVFAPYKSGDPTTLAYKDMTAIDFTGYNGDVTDYPTVAASDYKQGLCASVSPTAPKVFFPPLLDNDGLEALRNFGLTKNWLVYTPDAIDGDATAADSRTNAVVLDYLKDPTYTETNATYRTVAAQDAIAIYGHAVVKKGTNAYTALSDHFLVDNNDFNAPTSYTFASGKRMWHQRRPDSYVDRTKGWEAISLPFEVELVTTQEKGEISHFYQDNTIGHEYWLREFKEGGTLNGDTFEANFSYPDKGTADKTYTNTFFWDYYYQQSGAARPDAHEDLYDWNYYSTTQTHKAYPYAAAAKPYIIGFPGTTYYEFDLSGTFKANNTHSDIPLLRKQVITFASHESTTAAPVTINVSDDEMITGQVTADGYIFHPSYLNESFDAGTDTYTLNANYDSDTDGVADCSSFIKVPAPGDPTALSAFRPYFTIDPNYPVKGNNQGGAKYITFNRLNSQLGNDEDQSQPSDRLDGDLIVKGKRGQIIVTSAYNEDTTVHIINAAGALIRTFTLAPGETVETNVAAGVYIVNKTKISIR